MWNSFKAEVNSFQEKKKIIVSKQALTTEVYLFPNTQEFANKTPIKANETHTYESVCFEKKIFFTSAFLGVGWSIHHLLLFIHDFSDYYNNIDIKYSFGLLIFFIHMYFKSILLTSPWLALLAVCWFSWPATLCLPLHPFPIFSFQLLACLSGSHQRVICCSRLCGWAELRPVDQTEYFPSSGCRFGAVLLVPGSLRLQPDALRPCSCSQVMASGHPHPKETIRLPHTGHMQIRHLLSAVFVKLWQTIVNYICPLSHLIAPKIKAWLGLHIWYPTSDSDPSLLFLISTPSSSLPHPSFKQHRSNS